METRTSQMGATQRAGLFVRQSSGLVRELGVRDTFAVAVAIITVGTIFGIFPLGLSALQNGDFYIPLIAAGVAGAVLAIMYGQLIAIFPRAGGDFVYASRVIHPLFGAAVGGALFVGIMLNGGFTGLGWGTIYLPFMFQSLGGALNVSALTDLGTWLAGQTPSFLSGAIFLVILGLVATRRIHVATTVMFGAFLLSLAGVLAALFVLATHSQSDFVAAFGRVANHPDAYASVVAAGSHAGLTSGVTLTALVSMFAITYIIPEGYNLGNVAGGEIKRASRTYVFGTLIALGVGIGLALVCWFVLTRTVGSDFMRAAAWVSQHDPATYAKISGDNPLNGGAAYAVMLSSDPITKILAAMSIPAALVANALAYIVVTSRIIFALSFDRLLPERLADVSERSHSPNNALALTIVGMVGFTAIGVYSVGFVANFRNVILVFYSLYLVTSVVAMVTPYRRRDLYEASPKIFAGSWFGLPTLTVIGALSVIFNGAAAFLIATQPAINGGSYSFSSVATLVVIGTIGLVLYLVGWLRAKRLGLDLSVAMKELPPE